MNGRKRTRILSTIKRLLLFGAAAFLFPCASAPAQRTNTRDLRQQFAQIALTVRGRVGVKAAVLESGASVGLHELQQFPMQSVYKLPIAMTVLHQVDQKRLALEQKVRVEKSDFVSSKQHSPIRDQNPNGTVLTVRDLLRFMVSESDGTACDVLLRLLGGPKIVTRYLRELGITAMVVATTEKAMGRNELVQYRNWATPQGAVTLLRVLEQGRCLAPPSRALLLQWMIESPTGPDRIKGMLPQGTIVAHKTGSSGTAGGLTRATNDIGLITLSNGRHLAIAIFVSDSRDGDKVCAAVIARIARAAWNTWSGEPPTAKKRRERRPHRIR